VLFRPIKVGDKWKTAGENVEMKFNNNRTIKVRITTVDKSKFYGKVNGSNME
jgi:hypothetical protein